MAGELNTITAWNRANDFTVTVYICQCKIGSIDTLQISHCDICAVKEPAVNHHYCIIDDREQWQMRKHFDKHTENEVIILATTLLLKTISTTHSKIFVVTAVQANKTREGTEKREEHCNNFDTLGATIHKVAIEYQHMLCVRLL